MSKAPADASVTPPRAFIRWSARVLCWFCWLSIALTAGFALLKLFNAVPESFISNGNEMATTVFRFDAGMVDPAANAEVMKGLRADWINRVAGLVPSALFIWALFSARTSFVGVSRGAYFSKPTILGLRNLSLAVLLYQTVAPLITAIPRALYVASVKGDRTAQVSMSFGMNEPIALILIFAAVVALVSTVMAHAAKLADENRQFV